MHCFDFWLPYSVYRNESLALYNYLRKSNANGEWRVRVLKYFEEENYEEKGKNSKLLLDQVERILRTYLGTWRKHPELTTYPWFRRFTQKTFKRKERTISSKRIRETHKISKQRTEWVGKEKSQSRINIWREWKWGKRNCNESVSCIKRR